MECGGFDAICGLHSKIRIVISQVCWLNHVKATCFRVKVQFGWLNLGDVVVKHGNVKSLNVGNTVS